MMRTVIEHPLEALTLLAGLSLEELSTKVGISVDDLQDFASGVKPLSARDRLAILATLASADNRDTLQEHQMRDAASPGMASREDRIPYNVQVITDLYEEALSEHAESIGMKDEEE